MKSYDKELEGCTFQPKLEAKKINMKRENNKDYNVHERLYLEARKNTKKL